MIPINTIMPFFFHRFQKLTMGDKLIALFICFFVMVVGLLVFKYIPESYYGTWIRFDASFHVTAAIFILYALWYVIDQNAARWRHTYIIASAVLVGVVAVERIVVGAHNTVGIFLALGISLGAIIISRWPFFKKKLDF